MHSIRRRSSRGRSARRCSGLQSGRGRGAELRALVMALFSEAGPQRDYWAEMIKSRRSKCLAAPNGGRRETSRPLRGPRPVRQIARQTLVCTHTVALSGDGLVPEHAHDRGRDHRRPQHRTFDLKGYRGECAPGRHTCLASCGMAAVDADANSRRHYGLQPSALPWRIEGKVEIRLALTA